jgi:hypothetical protein
MNAVASAHPPIPGNDFFVAAATVLAALTISVFLGSRFISTTMRRTAFASPTSWRGLFRAQFLKVAALIETAAFVAALVGLFLSLNALARKPTHEDAVGVYLGLDTTVAALWVVIMRAFAGRRDDEATPQGLVWLAAIDAFNFVTAFVFILFIAVPAPFRP